MRKLLGYIIACSIMHLQAGDFSSIQRANRRFNAKNVRIVTTGEQAIRALDVQLTNGDEQRYPDKRASFGKTLAQLMSGLINTTAFNQLVMAMQSVASNSFLDITMGTSPVQRRLVDPQAGFAFAFEGADGWIFSIPPAPALASTEAAGEMVEIYWQALLRDVPFNQYDTNLIAAMAIADLNTLSDFRGPKRNGVVTPQTLSRGNLPGDLVGPYVSQFLYLPVPIGSAPNFDGGPNGTPGIDFQAQKVPTSGNDNNFMTTIDEWAAVQRGEFPTRSISFTNDRIFIRNGRDLGDYVHLDFPGQPSFHAALILANFGSQALDQNNPYLNNPTQEAFVTYGICDVLHLVVQATENALKSAWYQKWAVHRRLRPEFFAFLINQQITDALNGGINQEVINSTAAREIFSLNEIINGPGLGTYLLPQGYPEGSPAHPSYPAGHATMAGAGATILKAFFNEDFIIPNPLAPNDANTELVPFGGSLTVGNELNKLASNISIGRDIAGVHYPSDARESLLLGEAIAIAVLENEAFAKNINFNGYTLTKFNGTKITVGAKKNAPQLPVA